MRKGHALLLVFVLILGIVASGCMGTSTSSTEAQSPSQSQSQTQSEAPGSGSNNWQLGWDASEPIAIDGKEYLVKEVRYQVEYNLSTGESGRFTITKGLRRGELNGKEVYVLYALVEKDGEEYNYTLYVKPGYLNEYTDGPLWLPSVGEMLSLGDELRLEIKGPDCHFLMEGDEFEGDRDCGSISEGFRKYDMLWGKGGFYGGIYGDVISYVSLKRNGNGYTVEKDGKVSLAGIDFDLYRVSWRGVVSYTDVSANGETLVAPKLPFPVEVKATLSFPGQKSFYVHVKLTGLKLVAEDSDKA